MCAEHSCNCIYRARQNDSPSPKDVRVLVLGTCECIRVTWHRAIKVADGTNVANHFTLKEGDCPAGLNVTRGSLKSGREGTGVVTVEQLSVM